MRQQLPKEIDPYRFAQQGRLLEGELSLKQMTRLNDLLRTNEGHVQVKMQFDVDSTGISFMQAWFNAILPLTCERCMGAMDWAVSIDTLLGLVRHEKLTESLSDQYEPWVIDDSDHIDPGVIVEDELILSLPIVARHEHDCLPENAWFSGDTDETESQQSADKPASPFAVLSALKTKK